MLTASGVDNSNLQSYILCHCLTYFGHSTLSGSIQNSPQRYLIHSLTSSTRGQVQPSIPANDNQDEFAIRSNRNSEAFIDAHKKQCAVCGKDKWAEVRGIGSNNNKEREQNLNA